MKRQTAKAPAADGRARGEQSVASDVFDLGESNPSGIAVHDAISFGFPASTLDLLLERQPRVSEVEIWNAIGLTDQAARKYRAQPWTKLGVSVSDRIFRLVQIHSLASDVLGGHQAGEEWLSAEAIGLEFRRPIELLRSTPGAAAVKQLLQRVKYGVYT